MVVAICKIKFWNCQLSIVKIHQLTGSDQYLQGLGIVSTRIRSISIILVLEFDNRVKLSSGGYNTLATGLMRSRKWC